MLTTDTDCQASSHLALLLLLLLFWLLKSFFARSSNLQQRQFIQETIRTSAGGNGVRTLNVTSTIDGLASTCAYAFGSVAKCMMACNNGTDCPLTTGSCSQCKFLDILNAFDKDPVGPCKWLLQKGTLYNHTVTVAPGDTQSASMCYDNVNEAPIYITSQNGNNSFVMFVQKWVNGDPQQIPDLANKDNCTCPGGGAKMQPKEAAVEEVVLSKPVFSFFSKVPIVYEEVSKQENVLIK
jgi:hypothetical protein